MTTENKAFPDAKRKTVGFIVNPVAGMGGAVGLKGTDGKDILRKAVSLGAKPVASLRAEVFLSELKRFRESIRLIVGAGVMGEDEARDCSFEYSVVGQRKEETSAEDTRRAAKEMLALKLDLLVFCGGDGTARNVLEAVGTGVPCFGVPTGVKMHSAVFAVDPKAATQLAIRFLLGELPLREAEVMDVDEEAFRAGRVSAELYGFLLVPFESLLIQEAKMASPMTENELRNQAAMAVFINELMKPNALYIVGPGTTTRTIGDLLDAKKTLLGVDLFLNRKIIAADVGERKILEALREKKEAVIVVTPIGGQGFVFGRGNQQISAKVIREVGLDNIVVIATRSKLESLRSLRVDTGDQQLDGSLRERGLDVVVDYKILRKMPVE
jgi:predicted polyphosphate/ATP-dependent NAD kinase